MDFKIVIKHIKPKVKETDPEKLAQIKEAKRLKKEAKAKEPKVDKPKLDKQPKQDITEHIHNINKSLYNIVGYTIDELNEKMKAPPPATVQYGGVDNTVKFDIASKTTKPKKIK